MFGSVPANTRRPCVIELVTLATSVRKHIAGALPESTLIKMGLVDLAGFIQQVKEFSSENKHSTALIADVEDKVLTDRRKINEFESENPRISKWQGLPDLKELNKDLLDACKSCAEDIRRNVEEQRKDYRYIWETIIEAKKSARDFLLKHGLMQYVSSFEKFGYEEVEDLLDADIEKETDLAGNQCLVVLDGNKLEMGQSHLATLTREIDNLLQRTKNIPRRMENIISSADKAAKTSQKFLRACQDTVDRARSLKDRTEASRSVRHHDTRSLVDRAGAAAATTGLGAFVLGTAAVVTGVGAVAAAGAAVASLAGGSLGGAVLATGTAVGLGLSSVALATLAGTLMASLVLFSDLFQRVTIEALENHQRNMDEKARQLERKWLNEIHTCVTMMESNNAHLKQKFSKTFQLPTSIGNIRSTFDTIFANLDTLQSAAEKFS